MCESYDTSLNPIDLNEMNKAYKNVLQGKARENMEVDESLLSRSCKKRKISSWHDELSDWADVCIQSVIRTLKNISRSNTENQPECLE